MCVSLRKDMSVCMVVANNRHPGSRDSVLGGRPQPGISPHTEACLPGCLGHHGLRRLFANLGFCALRRIFCHVGYDVTL